MRVSAAVTAVSYTHLDVYKRQVNYRDWPMADWGWVMDLCADGVEQAAATGRWTAICPSNFCGPQYRGMWRDIAWHRRLTDIIKSSPLAGEFRK